MEQSLGRRVLRAGLAVGIAHALFKLAGLVQVWAMGRYLEKPVFDVVYGFAFENCVFAIFLCFEEVVAPAFVPVFMRTMKDHGEETAQRFAGKFLSLQFAVVLVIFLLLAAFPETVVRIWTAWTPENEPEKFARAAWAVRGLAPALFGLSLGATTYAMLNGHKRFFIAAFGDAVWKFAVVAALCAAAAWHSRDMARMLVAGIVIGSVCKLATHLWGLRGKLRHVRPSLRLDDPFMRSVLWLALPLIAGIVFAKVRDNYNNVHVLSRLDNDGLIQANSIGKKFFQTFQFIIPVTLAKAVFPFFCELADRRDMAGVGRFVTHYGRMMLAVFYPLCGVVMVVAAPLVALVFMGGKFDAQGVEWTAMSMRCYTFMLPAMALEAVLMQAFFARRRVFSVTALGIVFSVASMGLSFLGFKWFGTEPVMVLAVIAGGVSLTRLLKTVALSWLLKRDAPVFPVGETLWFLGRVAVCTTLAAACAWLALRGLGLTPWVARLPEKVRMGAEVCAGGAAGALATLAGFWLLRIREPFDMMKWIFARVQKNKKALA
ncbi:MAG: hypothetical protein FWF96_01030 [Kiritimatiellaeota bacterium]|nr:hypothetical protein [Kiritimatiellota bacterium]